MQPSSSLNINGWRSILRTIALVLASVAFSLCFACAAPLVAFGVFAALTMTRKQALWFIAGVWAANQATGYLLLNYPQTANSFSWGAAMGVAALVATAAASRLRTSEWDMARMIKAFAIAFVAYEVLLVIAGAVALGGMESFAPPIVGWVAALNMLALAGLIGYARLEQMVLSALSGKGRTVVR